MAKRVASHIIGTHSGTFHCDEAMAVGMLRHLNEYSKSSLIRSRDPVKLSTCDILVDVGGMYEHKAGRYDHHQKGFEEYFEDRKTTRLSSCGLIYRHFGKQVLQENFGVKDGELESVYKRLYKVLIESVDANDNGVSVAEGELKYSVTTALPSRINRLNPNWNEEVTDEERDNRFEKAVHVAWTEFAEQAKNIIEVLLPARGIVEAALKLLVENEDLEHLELPSWCPYMDHLYELEKEMAVEGRPKYVVYPANMQWTLRAIGVENVAFKNRLTMPKNLCGLRCEALSKEAGIPELVFVHAAGFIGAAKTRESVMKLLTLCLKPAA